MGPTGGPFRHKATRRRCGPGISESTTIGGPTQGIPGVGPTTPAGRSSPGATSRKRGTMVQLQNKVREPRGLREGERRGEGRGRGHQSRSDAFLVRGGERGLVGNGSGVAVRPQSSGSSINWRGSLRRAQSRGLRRCDLSSSWPQQVVGLSSRERRRARSPASDP